MVNDMNFNEDEQKDPFAPEENLDEELNLNEDYTGDEMTGGKRNDEDDFEVMSQYMQYEE